MKDDLVERVALAMRTRTRPVGTMLECEDLAHAVLAIARPAILEEAAAVADAAAKNASEFALMHPEDSESRFKMNGRVREAYDIAAAIRALAHTTGKEGGR